MAKILYVEDNPANRVLVRQVLEVAGHTIVEAVDGLHGIETAQVEQPDLILMDINIPGMDGFQTTTRLKSMPETKDTPIIALTAKTLAGDRERALTAGCDGYLAKPIDVDQLPRQVAEFLQGRREQMDAAEQNAYLREYNEQLVNNLELKVKELTEANKVLAHADTMKSRFINLAAHELRSPLAAVHGYLSILTAPNSNFMTTADDGSREIVGGIVTSVGRLRGIVQDMLDVTRIEAGTLQLKPTPVSLSLIFERLAREFTPVVEKRAQQLIIADATDIPTIWADGERITQILRNLVGNSIKYTPDGGQIEVSAQLLNPSRQAATRYVKLTVSDNGVGIDPEQQEKIFEHFYEVRSFEQHSSSKTDFMGSGAGLGLPIARGVAEAHGGSLWVESPGHNPDTCPGSTFHLIIPMGESPG